MASQVMIPVSPETKTRVYHLKGDGKTYDKFIVEALNAYEKMNEIPAESSQE